MRPDRMKPLDTLRVLCEPQRGRGRGTTARSAKFVSTAAKAGCRVAQLSQLRAQLGLSRGLQTRCVAASCAEVGENGEDAAVVGV
jgi:hypothetical protein